MVLMLLLATMLLVGACGSSDATSPGSGKKVTIDVGGGKIITVTGPPKVAFFTFGSNNAYMSVINPSMKRAIEAIPGAEFTMFDPAFDPQKQLNQLQNALASRRYNAWIVDAVDGSLICNIVTKEAPAANIAVVQVAGPACGLEKEPSSQDHWAPGTVAIVDNLSTNFLVDWYEYVVKKNPGPQKVIVVTGPDTHPTFLQHKNALAEIQAKYPDFKVVAIAPTDFSRLKGQQVTQSLLLAHPDATLLMGIYSDITEGALTAIAQAGKTGQIKVYDRGGSAPIIEAIKAGTVAATTANYPIDAANAATDALRRAFAGEEGPRVILNDGGPVPAGSETGMTPIDSSNVADFHVEYGG
ncbi:MULTISPECIES: sugar ABC transporter substrate-binding protein [unclassified Pseudofrankia]|uniref:sugar ABC transporter substrate-binding protein n=1 Tax=unclassified Pseudofrankia TaxID=2994372 RepID=UPI0012FF8266|nr:MULTISPECIES: sugar ABC transporter substrate-binding protein [unclassified Pseudofrankia]MDT3444923.1 sugar ABC transporter substrate-binding protein [Pseudofrankia sp. BMG5.37]